MAYNVHEFKSGDKLYAAQLNEMDTQIAANTEEIDTLKSGGAVSWNDVTDKPFGEKEEWVEIIPETSVTFATGGKNEAKDTFASYGNFSVGCEYKVVFDGKEYTGLQAIYQGVYIMPIWYDEMTEEYPFAFYQTFGAFYALEAGTHTVAVYRKETVVTKIPGKYVATKLHLNTDGSIAAINGYAATNKQAVKEAFEEGFANGIVRIEQYVSGKTCYGTVIGYNKSGNTVNVKYCNGSDSTITEATWSFA